MIKNNLVLFIHGLNGNEATWKNKKGQKFSNLLREDLILEENFDFKEYDYYTKFSSRFGKEKYFLKTLLRKRNKINVPIKQLALTLKSEISIKYSDYKNIILIGHSMGGLISKAFILDCIGEEDNKITVYISLAVPHNGSAIADATREIFKNPQLVDLSSDSEALKELSVKWIEKKEELPESYYFFGAHDLIVPQNKSIPTELSIKNNNVYLVEEDHISIAKPESENSIVVKGIKKILKDYLKNSDKPIKKETPKLLYSSQIDGDYFFESELYSGNLKITKISGKMVQFSLCVINKFGGNGIGHIEGEAFLKNDIAHFRTRESYIRFDFINKTIKVTTETSVPLGGMGIEFDGIYHKEKSGKNDTITVNNIKEFLNNIGSRRKIFLKRGIYNLSESIALENPYINWIKEFDGYGMEIVNLENFELDCETGTQILIDATYANVLTFKSCNNINLKNLIFGHSKQGHCVGGVLSFTDCNDIEIEECTLFGCGSTGLILDKVNRLNFIDSIIKECSYELMFIKKCSEIYYKNSTFKNTKEFDLINIENSSSIEFDSCIIKENFCSEEKYSLFKIDDLSDILYI